MGVAVFTVRGGFFFLGEGGEKKKKKGKKKGKKNTPFKKFIPEMDSPIKALQRAIDR